MSVNQKIVSELVKAGRDPKDLALAYTAFYFRHLYIEWCALINAYPYEKADRLYQYASWLHPEYGLGPSLMAFVDANKLEIKDVVSFAKAVSEQWKGFPIRLDIVKATEDEVIMENPTGFCPNPGFSPRPWDRYIDRCVYANVDGWQGTKQAFDKGYLVLAGLSDKYELEMLEAVCLGYPTCKWAIRKKKE